MKNAVYVLSVALIGALSIGTANAMPSSSVPAKAAFQSETVQLVDHRPDHYRQYKGKKKFHKHRYRAGRRYSRAPSGWKRHTYRPYYWQTRGCIIVGPVWFCP